MAARNTIQLKIAIDYIKPQIWRRVSVPDNYTLEGLHNVIQIAMGWHNCHLHRFEIDGINYTFGRESPEMYMQDEGKARLADVIKQVKQNFLYEYDFGDSWFHIITVEKIAPIDPARVPRRRAGVPARRLWKLPRLRGSG